MVKRLAAVGCLFLLLPLLMGQGSGGCGGNPPPPQVCLLCAQCVANPATQGCAQLLASGVCDSCGIVPPTTSTTTQPPVPIPTPTPTPIPTPIPTPVPTPTPTPTPTGCTAPQGVSWAGPGAVTISAGPMVNVVMTNLTGCMPGSDCRHGDGIGEVGAQKWMARVIAQLQLRGLCAGQHETGVTDEIAVATQCNGPWEGYHVANFGGGKVVWSPNAARPTWTPQSGCSAGPPPSPLPTPTPGPVPTPTPPPAGSCPIPAPGDNWVYDLKFHGGQLLDLTPWVGNPTRTPNVPWPGCGVNRCPISIEKGPIAAACGETLFGDPIWSTFAGTCNVFPPDPNSLMTVKVASGSCRLSVRGSKGAPTVGSWPVFAASPACNIGSNGLCSQ
jgi:hypothetical protein